MSASGFRTPRRIQWLDEHRTSDRATRMLDSSGVDVSGLYSVTCSDTDALEQAESFGNLVDSLEKHRKELPTRMDIPRGGLTSKVHYYSHRPDRSGGRGGEADSTSSPNDAFVRHEKDGDYDEGVPENGRELQGHSSASRLHFPPPLSPGIINDKDGGIAEASAYNQKAKWSAKVKAKQIVRHHSQKRPQRDRGDDITIMIDPAPQLDDGAASDVDKEESRTPGGGNGYPDIPGGGGILSSLLELYRHQEAGSATPSERNLASTCSSTITSGYSTPYDSGWQSPTGESCPDSESLLERAKTRLTFGTG